MSDIRDLPMTMLDGANTTFGDAVGDRAALVVNVASRCGLTPQYSDLEALHEELAERGFTVLGFPCNQFGGQEPGTSEEIAAFCSTTYGVTFPLSSKIEVNGPGRHPVYQALTEVADERGYSGDIRWNFEKFLISPDGRITARFHHKTLPSATHVREAIEAVLATPSASSYPHS
jgi:glutathione peroxidase